MVTGLARRTLLSAVVAAAATRATTACAAVLMPAMHDAVAELEASHGGRLGVAVLDTASGARFGYRADERFPLCSTFKWLEAAAMLVQVDAGRERLDRRIVYGADDLLPYAPITRAHLQSGGMSVADLCAAAIQWSDNTAGNLLLRLMGGPAGYTRFARALGDPVTRLDRNEPTLNTAFPGDPRDTTSPAAMVSDLRAVLLGPTLTAGSRARLEGWLDGNQVGHGRLRAGLPATWRVGDKTGTGDHGTTNDLAIIRPPGRAPILAAVYYTGSSAPLAESERVHADIGRLIARNFGR